MVECDLPKVEIGVRFPVPAPSEAREDKQANFFACVGESKAAAMCEFSEAKRRKGEHREAGSRKFFVRKIIRDRFPVPAPNKLAKTKDVLSWQA